MQNENTTAQIIDIVAKITQEMMTTQSNSNNDLENTGYPLHHFIKNISPTSSADLRNNIDNKNE